MLVAKLGLLVPGCSEPDSAGVWPSHEEGGVPRVDEAARDGSPLNDGSLSTFGIGIGCEGCGLPDSVLPPDAWGLPDKVRSPDEGWLPDAAWGLPDSVRLPDGARGAPELWPLAVCCCAAVLAVREG